MIHSNICNQYQDQDEDFKQIEDIIDARKRLGQYDVQKFNNPLNIKCVYSSFQKPQDVVNKAVKFDESSLGTTDKESLFANVSGVRHTDSEITIVRVKCTETVFQGKLNKWDMNDIAIPGDGTHLGESPSLVNLATLVEQNVQCEGDDEYLLVPLSSWDPFIKTDQRHPNCQWNDEFQQELKCCSDSKLNEKYFLHNSYTDPNISSRKENSSSNTQMEEESQETNSQYHRANWAGKISKLWRRLKTKSLSEPESIDWRLELNNENVNKSVGY